MTRSTIRAFILSIFAWGMSAAVAECEPLQIEKVFIEASINPGKDLQTELRISDKVSIPARVAVTEKGNGVLVLPGVSLRLWDDHDDGLVYQKNPLKLDFSELSHPGEVNLIVTGIARHTGEKETDPSWDEPIASIYRLDCAAGKFRSIFSSMSFSIEVSGGNDKSYHCPN